MEEQDDRNNTKQTKKIGIKLQLEVGDPQPLITIRTSSVGTERRKLTLAVRQKLEGGYLAPAGGTVKGQGSGED